MGFRKQPTHYKLKFTDEEYDGFEVTAKALSVGDFLKLTEAADKPAEAQSVIISMLADALVNWNLEDEKGKPVPATRKGVESLEFGFLNAIVQAWMTAIAGIDPKQLKTSNPSLNTESLPMEAL